jgi:hypothetical protein
MNNLEMKILFVFPETFFSRCKLNLLFSTIASITERDSYSSDAHYIKHVKEAYAFLGDGMSKIEASEKKKVNGKVFGVRQCASLGGGVRGLFFNKRWGKNFCDLDRKWVLAREKARWKRMKKMSMRHWKKMSSKVARTRMDLSRRTLPNKTIPTHAIM